MSIVALLLVIALAGLIVWLVLQIPMHQVFRNVILGVAAVALILFLLQCLGVSTGLPHLKLF